MTKEEKIEKVRQTMNKLYPNIYAMAEQIVETIEEPEEAQSRFANKGPLPPPVVDFSTDQCPTCGEVLNQCKCPQVLQRVHFNDEQIENQKLKELLYEVATCGVEHDDERLDYVTVQIDRRTWDELMEMRDKGEMRG